MQELANRTSAAGAAIGSGVGSLANRTSAAGAAIGSGAGSLANRTSAAGAAPVSPGSTPSPAAARSAVSSFGQLPKEFQQRFNSRSISGANKPHMDQAYAVDYYNRNYANSNRQPGNATAPVVQRRSFDPGSPTIASAPPTPNRSPQRRLAAGNSAPAATGMPPDRLASTGVSSFSQLPQRFQDAYNQRSSTGKNRPEMDEAYAVNYYNKNYAGKNKRRLAS